MERYFDMDRLAIIEQCIFNDLRAIEDFQYHIKALYKLRDEELEKQGIDKEEWIAAVKELQHAV